MLKVAYEMAQGLYNAGIIDIEELDEYGPCTSCAACGGNGCDWCMDLNEEDEGEK